jgi:hypothetical protein
MPTDRNAKSLGEWGASSSSKGKRQLLEQVGLTHGPSSVWGDHIREGFGEGFPWTVRVLTKEPTNVQLQPHGVWPTG